MIMDPVPYTMSLAPRLRNRAPAKYRERRAITVMCAVRPNMERASKMSNGNRCETDLL